MNVVKQKLAFLIICFLWLSCSSGEPPIDIENTDWKTYRNRVIGFDFKFPATFTYDVQDMGHNVFLKHKNINTILVRYSTPEEGKKRGLWFGHKADDVIEINGYQWTRYVYGHGDGPFVSTTTAYVTTLNDRFLGIEFRTDVANEEFQNFVMKSFQFLEPEEPRRVIY